MCSSPSRPVVCVLELHARLLCSESADRLRVVDDVPAWVLCRQIVGLVCILEAHIQFLNTL